MILYFLVGKLVFFSEGILFVHPHYGSITLSMSHINTIKLYDGVSNVLIHDMGSEGCNFLFLFSALPSQE